MSNFAFIDVNEVSDEQRARNRSLIRSRAMQAVRQRQRQKKQQEQRERPHGDQDSSRSGSIASASGSSDSSGSPESAVTVPSRTNTTIDEVLSEDSGDTIVVPITSPMAAALIAAESGNDVEMRDANALILQSPFQTPGPMELLSAARGDPFGVYPTPSTPTVSELVDHCEFNKLFSYQLPMRGSQT